MPFFLISLYTGWIIVCQINTPSSVFHKSGSLKSRTIQIMEVFSLIAVCICHKLQQLVTKLPPTASPVAENGVLFRNTAKKPFHSNTRIQIFQECCQPLKIFLLGAQADTALLICVTQRRILRNIK